MPDDPLAGRICPFLHSDCIRDKCLAYDLTSNVVYDEEELQPVGDSENNEVRDAAVSTGKTFAADIATCRLGVFGRVLLDKREVDPRSPQDVVVTDRQFSSSVVKRIVRP